jgi:hypothetical protein
VAAVESDDFLIVSLIYVVVTALERYFAGPGGQIPLIDFDEDLGLKRHFIFLNGRHC